MAVCYDDFDSGKYDEDDGATSISYPMYPSELGADRGRADGHDGDDGDDDDDDDEDDDEDEDDRGNIHLVSNVSF